MPLSKLGLLLLGVGTLLPVDAIAAPSSLRLVAYPAGIALPGPVAVAGAPCPTLCRPAPPRCLSGSRWYGPYGSICYRYRTGPTELLLP
jgi:hypothetical protein